LTIVFNIFILTKKYKYYCHDYELTQIKNSYTGLSFINNNDFINLWFLQNLVSIVVIVLIVCLIVMLYTTRYCNAHNHIHNLHKYQTTILLTFLSIQFFYLWSIIAILEIVENSNILMPSTGSLKYVKHIVTHNATNKWDEHRPYITIITETSEATNYLQQ